MEHSNAAKSLMDKQIEANIVGEEKARYSMIISSTEEIQKSQSLLTSMKTQAGTNAEKLKKVEELESKLFDIFEERINLTHSIIKRSLMAPIVGTAKPAEETKLEVDPKQEPAKKEAVIKQGNKVIQLHPTLFLKGWNRRVLLDTPDGKFEPKILDLIKNAKTEAHIDEITTILLTEAIADPSKDSYQKIVNALNLSIDLFTTLKLKEQLEIEKRFVNTILPQAFGITPVKEVEANENIALAFWVNNLKTLKNQKSAKIMLTSKIIEEIKTKKIVSASLQEIIDSTESGMFAAPEARKSLLEAVASELKMKVEDIKFEAIEEDKELIALIPVIVKEALEDIKSVKCITIKTQCQFEKFRNAPNLEKQILGKIVAGGTPGIKGIEDIVWESISDADTKLHTEVGRKSMILKPVESTSSTTEPNNKDKVPFTLSALKDQVFAKLKANEDPGKVVLPFFTSNYEKVSDKATNKNVHQIWGEFFAIYKKENPDNKEIIVAKAEEAAIAGQESIIDEVVEEQKAKIELTIKEFFRKKKLDKKFNADNEASKFMKSPDVRSTFKGESTEKLIKKWKNEVDKEAVETKTDEQKTVEAIEKQVTSTVMQKIDIEKAHPDLWKKAQACCNVSEFSKLVKDLNKNGTSTLNGVSMDTITCNLSNQYLNKFKESETWTDEKKDIWFESILKAIQKPTPIKEETKEKLHEALETAQQKSSEGEKPIVDVKDPMPKEANEVSTEQNTKPNDVFLKYEELIKKEAKSDRAKVHVASFLLDSTLPIEERKVKASELLKANNIWKKAPQKDRDNTVAKIIKDNPKVAELVPVTV